MIRLVLALAVALLPSVAAAATLHGSPPTHPPAPRAARVTPPPVARVAVVSAMRDTAVFRAPPREPRRARRQTVAGGTIHVHDGDTFYVGRDAFRLRGIDTPELGEPGAEAARGRLRALLHAGPVTIARRGEDVYGRILADVYVSGRNVARVLRAEGHAKRRARALSPPRYRSLDIPRGLPPWDPRR